MTFQDNPNMDDSAVFDLLTDTLSLCTAPEVIQHILDQADAAVAYHRKSFHSFRIFGGRANG